MVPTPGLDPGYDAELTRARTKTGLDESVVTGEGRIAGRRIALIACEFGFLAGSIGVAAAERLVRAIERATEERLPLLAAPTSGGTRMQEGTIAFVQMVKISIAVVRHRSAGLPYLVYIRNPTTGGVFASWGSLGHVTVAEPGALIGFLGPRVYEALHGEPFPVGVQVAENLFEQGVIDAVIPAGQLAAVAERALDVLDYDRTTIRPLPEIEDEPVSDVPAWDSIQRSRQSGRPGIRELMEICRHQNHPIGRHWRGRDGARLVLRTGQVRTSAMHRPRPRPPSRRTRPDGAGRSSRGQARIRASQRARTSGGHCDRYRRSGTVQGGRRRWTCRRDRPLSGRIGDAARTDGLPDIGPRIRRWRLGLAARGPCDQHSTRLVVSATSRRGFRDHVPNHRSSARDRPEPGRSIARSAA